MKRFENRFEEKNDDFSKKHFFVPIEEIEKNDFDLSISKYKKIEYEEPTYRKPKVILKEMKKTIKEIDKEILELEKQT